MNIAIIGWGSLVWCPRDLPIKRNWQRGGPVLPIEFSRVSKDARLTLVIDPKNGKLVTTQFVFSSRTDLQDAVADLRDREETKMEFIGFTDRSGEQASSRRWEKHRDAQLRILPWLEKSDFDAAVWTALEANYEQQQGRKFSVDDAAAYLKNLPESPRENALRYIRSAPAEVDTRLRQKLAQQGLLEEKKRK